MLIGIDGNEANVEQKVGISEYAYELLIRFSEFRVQNLEFRIYLKDKPRDDMPKEREGWRYIIVKPKKLWTQIGLPLDLMFGRPRPDVFFSPTHYGPRFSPIKTAVSVMDLSYVYFPRMFRGSDLYQLVNWTKYSVEKAKKVFTISRASRDDIIKTYHLSPDKVVVTYPGIKMETKNSTPTKSGSRRKATSQDIVGKYDIKGDYVLFVGTLQPRKNIVRLISAFLTVSKEFDNLQLVVIGKRGWMYEDIMDAPKKMRLEAKVRFLSYVTDEDLPAFYKEARCFVLPSLYEGFGLPVLEAMKYGCPAVISRVSSLPEVGGNAALYVDPEDEDDIAEKIKKVLSDKTLRKELIEKGYEQVKKFSWEKTAQQTLEVLKQIAKQ